MPAGASSKREREYRKLKQEFQHSGRYKGREEEVASRIVNKQRAEFGETRDAKAQERAGQSPDRNLPLAGYEHMTIPQVTRKLNGLSAADLRKLRQYESRHKNRKGLLALYERYLKKS